MSFLQKFRGAKKIKDQKSLSESKSFCVMPWVHFHITQYGTVTPCCQAPWQEETAFGNINTQTIKEIWSGEKMNAFRKQMLEGKTDVRCEGCFVKERSGFTSLREITNKKYKHKTELVLSTAKNGSLSSAQPVYFDIRFSNVCNLKCRICGPWSSSNWYTDALALGMLNKQSQAITRSFQNPEEFFMQFAEGINSLEELYFAGGEPLVIDEHYRLLELLIAQGKTNVKLTYNTNFSSLRFKQHDLIALWQKFPNISIAASLDASEARGEFLRKNIKWSDVIENRKTILKELPYAEFVVSPTLNIYNLLHLPDFHKDWVAQGLISVEDFIPTLLVTPVELSVHILPQAFKNKALLKYKEHFKWINTMPFVNTEKKDHMLKQFENIIKCLTISKSDQPLELFIKSSLAMDKLRTEKTCGVFPELQELFQL